MENSLNVNSTAVMNFIKGLESPIQDLLSFDESFFSHPLYGNYLKGVIYYLESDLDNLEFIINKFENIITKFDEHRDEFILAISILKMRRMNRLQQKSIELDNLEVLHKTSHRLWNGERYLVLARYYELARLHEKAAHFYQLSSQSFHLIECLRKSVKSQFNFLVCKERSFLPVSLPEYSELYFKAIKVNDYPISGTILIAQSLKLQNWGAYQAALRFANRALYLLKKEAGSLNYYLGLVHRCHLYIVMERASEALKDFEEAQLSSYVEIRSILNLLAKELNQGEQRQISKNQINYEELPFGWEQRVQEGLRSSVQLSSYEDKLLALLIWKPREKEKIFRRLWGATLDNETLDTRWKQVLSRLRNKHKVLIRYEDGLYALQSNILMPEKDDGSS